MHPFVCRWGVDLYVVLGACAKQQDGVPGLVGVLGEGGWIAPSLGFILLGDFNFHVGNHSDIWRGIIRRNGPPALKPCGVSSVHNENHVQAYGCQLMQKDILGHMLAAYLEHW